MAIVENTPSSMNSVRNFFFAALKSATAPSTGLRTAMKMEAMVCDQPYHSVADAEPAGRSAPATDT